jgi:hypothetical protein
MRMRFDFGLRAVARRGGVLFMDGEGSVGGLHARRELRVSWEGGSGILLIISRDARSRIWRRVPNRQAVCVAVGEGTEREVAGIYKFRIPEGEGKRNITFELSGEFHVVRCRWVVLEWCTSNFEVC